MPDGTVVEQRDVSDLLGQVEAVRKSAFIAFGETPPARRRQDQRLRPSVTRFHYLPPTITGDPWGIGMTWTLPSLMAWLIACCCWYAW